ncbi:MAG: hypothetical protein II737_06825, partial [Mailhella sp.]|nr:hypothetical protein [Mailhella sp.]
AGAAQSDKVKSQAKVRCFMVISCSHRDGSLSIFPSMISQVSADAKGQIAWPGLPAAHTKKERPIKTAL